MKISQLVKGAFITVFPVASAFAPNRGAFSMNSSSLMMAENSVFEKVLAQPRWPASWPYSEDDFVRMDESDDFIFYQSPRL